MGSHRQEGQQAGFTESGRPRVSSAQGHSQAAAAPLRPGRWVPSPPSLPPLPAEPPPCWHLPVLPNAPQPVLTSSPPPLAPIAHARAPLASRLLLGRGLLPQDLCTVVPLPGPPPRATPCWSGCPPPGIPFPAVFPSVVRSPPPHPGTSPRLTRSQTTAGSSPGGPRCCAAGSPGRGAARRSRGCRRPPAGRGRRPPSSGPGCGPLGRSPAPRSCPRCRETRGRPDASEGVWAARVPRPTGARRTLLRAAPLPHPLGSTGGASSRPRGLGGQTRVCRHRERPGRPTSHAGGPRPLPGPGQAGRGPPPCAQL